MLEDLLFELNDKARELLTYASGLKQTVSATEKPTAEVIGEVDRFLSKACTTLDEVLKILAGVDSQRKGNDGVRFVGAASTVFGRRLTYKELIGDEITSTT